VNTVVAAHGGNSSLTPLKIDLSNAFNVVSRDAILAAVRQHFPGLATWVETYAQDAHLRTYDRRYLRRTGVQQGDPLGPLLFALVLQPVLKTIQLRCLALRLNVSYLDNITLIGPMPVLGQALEILCCEGPRVGLHVNLPKSELWWLNFDLPTCAQFIPSAVVRRTGNGVELLGGPVGGPVTCVALMASRVAHISEICGLLDSLEDSQVSFALLRSCAGFPKLSFSLRTSSPEFVATHASAFDNLMQRTLSHILGADIPDSVIRQALLPPSLGALGA
jgi:hypothetical protein